MPLNDIFDKVLFVGPDLDAPGGIASVLKMYRKHLPSFHYVASNSRHGTLAGLFVLAIALIKILIHRLVGKQEILHIHAASGKSFIRKSLIIFWASLLGYKTIFHNHAGDFIDYTRRIGLNRVKSLLARTTCTVALAPVFVDFFRRDLEQKNVYLIHNMIEPSTAVSPKRIEGAFNILFLGVLTDEKGIFELVNAVKVCQETTTKQLRLWIGGKGDDMRLRMLIQETGLSNVCIPLGWIGGTDKLQLLAGCDVFILPSHFECLPMSILEAMTYMKPVIATNVGGVPYIVRDGINGTLIEPQDKQALVSAIMNYVDNSLLLKAQGAEAVKVATQFYPNIVITQLKNLYTEVLK